MHKFNLRRLFVKSSPLTEILHSKFQVIKKQNIGLTQVTFFKYISLYFCFLITWNFNIIFLTKVILSLLRASAQGYSEIDIKSSSQPEISFKNEKVFSILNTFIHLKAFF